MYLIKGLVFWHTGTIGTRRLRPGYLYIIKSENFIDPNTGKYLARYNGAGGRVHGGAFMYVMGTNKNMNYYIQNEGLLVSGFSYHNGQWKWKSGTANGRSHPTTVMRHPKIKKAVMNAILQFWDTRGTKQNWNVDNSNYQVQNLRNVDVTPNKK